MSPPRADSNAVEQFESELDDMVREMQLLDPMLPDICISTCMGFMARCTEIWVFCIRNEGRNRSLRSFRTAQLQKLMDMIEFAYKSSSRMTEIRRQELETSR